MKAKRSDVSRRYTRLLLFFGLCFPTMAFSSMYAGLNYQFFRLYARGSHYNLNYTNRNPPLNSLGNFTVKDSDKGTSAGIVIGYAMNHSGPWFPETRLSLQASKTVSTPRLSGHFDYTLFTPHDSYTYHYDVQETLLGVNVETDIYRWHHMAPFIGVGAGVAWLKSKYSPLTPLNNSDPVSYQFKGARKRTTYYQGEVGVRYKYNHYAVTLAYVYQDLGKISSGPGETATGSVSPAVEDRLRQHNLQLQLGYYF